jgi:hypothetical protein
MRFPEYGREVEYSYFDHPDVLNVSGEVKIRVFVRLIIP